ncbi:MAG: hypothetical protein V4671_21840 [Armatimonadota bacterium]
MSKTLIKLKNISPCVVLTAFVCLGLGLSNQSLLFAQQPPANEVPKAPRLGEFNVRRFTTFQLVSNRKAGVNSFVLTNTEITSPRYDFTGNKITLDLKNGRAQTGLATGNVHVTVRDLVYNETTKRFVSTQTIDADCDRASYAAGKEQGQGRIDFSGNVLVKVQGPEYVVPLVLRGKTGSIEFVEDGKTIFAINEGSATATLREPAPTKK